MRNAALVPDDEWIPAFAGMTVGMERRDAVRAVRDVSRERAYFAGFLPQ